ncbi:MAG: enoyl-CoA hydratase-related protein [Pseudomonadales bacterium]|nr:enoyl-CoA hydratase-related protein [Pseudomonadales bacterium]MDP6470412.1 enoyl-CoA hydratase-related protein [Pseudomonadales bacterium]MDP6827712.1 enoyl-CoA hydratase-related protein [Pseudomonadales bacterium]MDP6973357.1 enoyl-CoA hydratase-related protein [Pseudomonadales bacterium]|tara:strand:+ start:1296 stop:2081 length:786 start_codon:yes stop_codon:yes gene_type:complete
MADEDIVLYEVDEHVATITLNRPRQRNALLVETLERLGRIWKKIDQDPEVRVAILTGSDCGTFCAGMDLKQMAEVREKEGVDILSKIGGAEFSNMRDIRTPLIAAINGHAPAGGLMLALNCDLRIAVTDARLAITEVHRGRGSPWAMPLYWQMPQSLVSELTLVGDFMPVQRFYDLGFINYIEPDVESLMRRARALAGRIAAAAPLSVEAAKRSSMATMDLIMGHALKEAAQLHEKAYASEDAIEGPRAFAEKRQPIWKGC